MQAGPMVEQGLPAAAAPKQHTKLPASAAVTAVTSCFSSTPLFFGHRLSAKWRGRALGNRGEATARRKAQNCYLAMAAMLPARRAG